MKALIVSPQPFFSPRGTPLSVYYRTAVTAELGVEVDLVTYGEGADVDLPGVNIIRIPRVPGTSDVPVGPSGKKVILDFVLLLRVIWLLLRRRYDVVHAHEESVFFCAFLKPLFGYQLVYDMHSSLPQQLRNFAFTKSRSLIWTFEKLENWSLRRADMTITICPDLAEYALSLIDDPEKHILIENSLFDEVRLANPPVPADTSSDDPEQLIEGRRTILYAGTFEPYQGVDLLIEAFALVREQAADALLVLVGGRPGQVREMQALVDRLGLSEHCVLTGQVGQREARAWNRRADVLTSPRQAGKNTPLKVYEQLASGKPLVATDIYAHTQVLTPAVCYLVEPTPDGMAGGLLDALQGTDRERRVGAARALYEEHYSPAAYRTKMRQFLETLGPCAA